MTVSYGVPGTTSGEGHLRAHLPDVEQQEFLTLRPQRSGDAIALPHEAQGRRARSDRTGCRVSPHSSFLRDSVSAAGQVAAVVLRAARERSGSGAVGVAGGAALRRGRTRRARRRCCLRGRSRASRGLPEETGDIVALTRAPWRTRRRRWRRCWRAQHRCCLCRRCGAIRFFFFCLLLRSVTCCCAATNSRA